MSASLSRTLQLLKLYNVDSKSTKRSLTNLPNCPEFPDSKWKNIIAGRAVNLDTVLSRQFSTSTMTSGTRSWVNSRSLLEWLNLPNQLRMEGQDRTRRAIAFAFPHCIDKLSSYGEYNTSLFRATNPSFHTRVIAFDRAVGRRVGSLSCGTMRDFPTSRLLTSIPSVYLSELAINYMNPTVLRE
jgi:hypothetical protein